MITEHFHSFGEFPELSKFTLIHQNSHFRTFLKKPYAVYFRLFSGKNFKTNHDVNLNKVNAIVDDHAFKTTAMLLFKKTMLLLTNIANENPELLKNIPEFLCQNINDVTGLLRFVTNVWHNLNGIRFEKNAINKVVSKTYARDYFMA